MANNTVSMRFPFASQIADQSSGVQAAHRYTFSALVDLNEAVSSLKSQIASSASTASSTTTTTTTDNTSDFLGLGLVNDETGNTSYTVQSTDNGALVIFNDASPVAVTLNSGVTTPYFFFATNFGAGAATLTPTTGTINGSSSFALPQNYTVVVVFDGTNWKTSASLIIPLSKTAVTSQWFNSYDATTGLFTSAQPAFTDISGTVGPSQLPNPTTSTLGGVEAIVAVAHEWVNAIDTSGVPQVSQPSFADVSGQITTAQLPSSGISATITTAALTTGGTNGSITVTNGIITAQVQAT